MLYQLSYVGAGPDASRREGVAQGVFEYLPAYDRGSGKYVRIVNGSSDSQPVARASSFRDRPSSLDGRRAVRLALISLAAIIISIAVNIAFESRDADTAAHDILHVIKMVFGILFMVGGISAFVLSLRAVTKGERSFAVWGALVLASWLRRSPSVSSLFSNDDLHAVANFRRDLIGDRRHRRRL